MSRSSVLDSRVGCAVQLVPLILVGSATIHSLPTVRGDPLLEGVAFSAIIISSFIAFFLVRRLLSSDPMIDRAGKHGSSGGMLLANAAGLVGSTCLAVSAMSFALGSDGPVIGQVLWIALAVGSAHVAFALARSYARVQNDARIRSARRDSGVRPQ